MNATDTREAPDAVELATRIAAHLAGNWRAERAPHDEGRGRADFAYLVRPAFGERLAMHVGRHPNPAGRTELRGVFPSFADGRLYSARREEYVSITVDAHRDAKAIAKEIERRLLPSYEDAFARAKAYIAAHDAAVAAASACAARLGFATDADTVRTGQGSSGEAQLWPKGATGVYAVKVRPDAESGPRVSFDVENLDERTALLVFALLKGGAP